MYKKLVLATTTYNGGIFPNMREFLDCIAERNYQDRTVALIENGSWAPVASNGMKARLEKCKNITYTNTSVKIRSALNAESEAQLVALADELLK
jgi:flavorubredoxin